MKPFERVRQIRLDKGLKQKYVASKLGISPALYNSIEHGKRPLRDKFILPLAEIFDVSPAIFFENEINKTFNNRRD